MNQTLAQQSYSNRPSKGFLSMLPLGTTRSFCHYPRAYSRSLLSSNPNSAAASSLRSEVSYFTEKTEDVRRDLLRQPPPPIHPTVPSVDRSTGAKLLSTAHLRSGPGSHLLCFLRTSLQHSPLFNDTFFFLPVHWFTPINLQTCYYFSELKKVFS